jgi:hypothetical protein
MTCQTYLNLKMSKKQTMLFTDITKYIDLQLKR